MKNKPILLVPGDTKSIFFEIFFKSIKNNKFRSPLILISSLRMLKRQIKKQKFKKKIRVLELENLKNYKLNNRSINLVNVDNKNPSKNFKFKSFSFNKISFDLAFEILNTNYTYKFINGPINKENFLKKRFLGMTEYISQKFKTKNVAMLIYNKDLSVCPITTHLPLKLVPNKISKKLIKEKTVLINNFFVKNFKFKPKIGVTGLNPHCESILKFNEDEKIISPAIKDLKKRGFKIEGPFAADTLFLKQNRLKYNVILGMYHDQVLSPIKTLMEYNAINITLGLPFYRVSPDHGPNEKMVNKNLSNPLSLIKAIKFLDTR